MHENWNREEGVFIGEDFLLSSPDSFNWAQKEINMMYELKRPHGKIHNATVSSPGMHFGSYPIFILGQFVNLYRLFISTCPYFSFTFGQVNTAGLSGHLSRRDIRWRGLDSTQLSTFFLQSGENKIFMANKQGKNPFY